MSTDLREQENKSSSLMDGWIVVLHKGNNEFLQKLYINEDEIPYSREDFVMATKVDLRNSK